MQFNGSKLKTLRKRAGLTQTQLADEIGSTMPSVSNWEVGKNDPPYEFIFKLCDFFKVEEDYFLIQQGPLSESEPSYTIYTEDGKAIQLKFVDPDEHKTAGDLSGNADGSWELAIDQVRSSFIGPVNGTIMVRNRAMEPEFNSSNAIAVKLLKHKNAITPGEVYYVIDNNQEGHLRRLYPHGDAGVRLVSNNPDTYPEYILAYSHIFVIFKVKANIGLF